MDEILTSEFVELLTNASAACGPPTVGGITNTVDGTSTIRQGRLRGWAEELDEMRADQPLERRTAARLVHEYMRIELGIHDIDASFVAAEIKDLYTCRVCANHVMQVCARKIMETEEITSASGEIVHIFNMLGTVTKSQAATIIARMYSFAKK